jgi:glycosyltransferase involved in cell wall biosynthesis
MKTISVIIPAYNDADRLERTLQQLRLIREQEYGALELVVSVRPSSDATEAVARRLADVVVEGGTVSRGRNNGARAAKGDLLVFLDADTFPALGTFTALAGAARERSIGSCTAYTEEGSFLAAGTVRLINFLRWSGLVKGLSNLLFCSRSLFHGHGVGYNEALCLGEHNDFVRRACACGYKFVYVRTRPGYVINMERHKEWGYFPLMLFWMRWALFCGLLKMDSKSLEAEYWERRGPALAKQPDGSQESAAA